MDELATYQLMLQIFSHLLFGFVDFELFLFQVMTNWNNFVVINLI